MLSGRRGFLGKVAGVFGLTEIAGLEDSAGSAGRDLLKSPPETMFPSEEYLRVSEELEEVVGEIRKTRDEDLTGSTIYLGNVNGFDFSIIDDRTFELDVVEEVVGGSVPGDADGSDYRELLEVMSEDRLNRGIEHGYMSKSPMRDNVEPRLLIGQRADIDVIELGDTKVEPGKVSEQLEDSSSPVLGSGYELSVGTRSVDLADYESADEAFRSVQEEYSEGSSGVLQVYLTGEDLGEFGLMGYAPIDGNTVVVATEKGFMFDYDSQDVAGTVVHEVGHSLFDIQHTADGQDVMRHSSSVDAVDFGRRSRLLIQRYLDSSLETGVVDSGDDSYLSIGFDPGEVGSQVAGREFEDHLEMFLYDVMGFEDVENWELDYRGQTSMGYDKARATRDFETGERIEMDIEIDYFIEDISTQASM